MKWITLPFRIVWFVGLLLVWMPFIILQDVITRLRWPHHGEEWRRWFAWHPVKICGKLVWWTEVEWVEINSRPCFRRPQEVEHG